jgi:hypothetical protein
VPLARYPQLHAGTQLFDDRAVHSACGRERAARMATSAAEARRRGCNAAVPAALCPTAHVSSIRAAHGAALTRARLRARLSDRLGQAGSAGGGRAGRRTSAICRSASCSCICAMLNASSKSFAERQKLWCAAAKVRHSARGRQRLTAFGGIATS